MKIKTLLVCIILGILVCSTAGVFATWRYAEVSPESKDINLNLGLNEFIYKPEEILPDDEQADKLGQNHLQLIENLLWVDSYGLNETKKPIIHDLLENTGDVVYGQENVQGGNLKHIFVDLSTESAKLMFVVEKVNSIQYMAYTFVYSAVTINTVGTYIEVYKTQIDKGTDNVWLATQSWLGEARVNSPAKVSRSIDTTSWRAT